METLYIKLQTIKKMDGTSRGIKMRQRWRRLREKYEESGHDPPSPPRPPPPPLQRARQS